MSNVYFYPIEEVKDFSESAKVLLKTLINKENIKLDGELPIKIHPGAAGNTAYNKPEYYNGIINFLKERQVNAFYIETCMEAADSTGKEKEFELHGFNQLPVVIADGPKGDEDTEISIDNSTHLKYSLIANRLAAAKQVLVVSHFKGHCMAGFGGAIKMLGIGFASGRGKTLVHGIKPEYTPGEYIDWDKSHLPGISAKWVNNWDNKIASSGRVFNERVAESAWAAVQNKQNIYITFAVNIVNNCDCDDKALEPVYKDLGIFASLDPVAIDKAVFDLLEKRESEKPFEGEEIFNYAAKLGLGSAEYQIITPAGN